MPTINQLSAYDVILNKLWTATEPLSVERQKKLASILHEFRVRHDEVLWQDSILKAESIEEDRNKYQTLQNKREQEKEKLKDMQFTPNPEPLPWEDSK